MQEPVILYQDETKKAIENFRLTGIPFSFRLAKAIAAIKYAAAEAHEIEEKLPSTFSNAIKKAAQEILDGHWQEQFVVDQVNGGAGTSMHMNVNEVIATRATILLETGERVHPNDHVNMSQSTNDVIPTAVKIASLELLDELIKTYEFFCTELQKKSEEWKDIIKVGRTHLQDAVPITLGQEFGAHAYAAKKDLKRLYHAKEALYEINLGGSAIGTGLTGSKQYIILVAEKLAELTHYPFFSSPHLISATQYPDGFLEVSSTLTICAANLIKMANDLRLLGCGPLAGFAEIQFEEKQKGSSIMPGKINPVMGEMLNQVCFQIIGNNQTILMATQAGQLELNVMLPIVGKNIFESLSLLSNGVLQFTKHGIVTLTANKEKCAETFEKSLCMATALSPKIGYDKTAELVKKAVAHKMTLKQVVLEEKIMTEQEYIEFFQAKNLTSVN